MYRVILTDWDDRPAVLFKSPGARPRAFALLTRGGPWTEVDAFDVSHTAAVIRDEALFKSMFASLFGAFELPPPPDL